MSGVGNGPPSPPRCRHSLLPFNGERRPYAWRMRGYRKMSGEAKRAHWFTYPKHRGDCCGEGMRKERLCCLLKPCDINAVGGFTTGKDGKQRQGWRGRRRRGSYGLRGWCPHRHVTAMPPSPPHETTLSSPPRWTLPTMPRRTRNKEITKVLLLLLLLLRIRHAVSCRMRVWHRSHSLRLRFRSPPFPMHRFLFFAFFHCFLLPFRPRPGPRPARQLGCHRHTCLLRRRARVPAVTAFHSIATRYVLR